MQFNIRMIVKLEVQAKDKEDAMSEAEDAVLNINDRVSADVSVVSIETTAVEVVEGDEDDDDPSDFDLDQADADEQE